MAGVPEDVIQLLVVGSAYIFDATRDAASIADRDHRTVAFMFNERIVVVRPGDDPDFIARTWWLESYGETPEQSLSRR